MHSMPEAGTVMSICMGNGDGGNYEIYRSKKYRVVFRFFKKE